MSRDQADQIVMFEKVFTYPKCVRETRADQPWNRLPQRVARETVSGLKVMLEEWNLAAARFDGLNVMYVQADSEGIPWRLYTPEVKDNHLSWRGDRAIVSSMSAVDSPVWLEFFASPEARSSFQTYSDLCEQSLQWERMAFPRVSPTNIRRNLVLTWTLGLFDLAWRHPSVSAEPRFRNGFATFSAAAVETAIRLKLPRFEYHFFMDVPVPLPGFFRILRPDCFRASAWRIRRVLECCLEGDPLDPKQPKNPPLVGLTQIEAAAEVGVHPATIARWARKDPQLIVMIRGKRRVNKDYLIANLSTLQEREFHGRSESRRS